VSDRNEMDISAFCTCCCRIVGTVELTGQSAGMWQGSLLIICMYCWAWFISVVQYLLTH